jgi:hypothetical protein
MSLRIVRRFTCIEEALVAASALHAADIPAFVLEYYVPTVNWDYVRCLGGIAVGVPASLLDDARTQLAQVEPPSRIEAWGGPHPLSTGLGFLFGVLAHAGMPFAAMLFYARNRARRAALIEGEAVD